MGRLLLFSGSRHVPVGGLICSDDFTRADGAAGATPVGRYPWGGGAIVSNALVITPTLGDELVSNGNMETGDPPTGWNALNATLDGVANERTGGAGAQSIAVTGNGGTGWATQTIATDVNTWVHLGGWARKDTATAFVALRRPSTATIVNNYTASVNWTYLTMIGRSVDASCSVALGNAGNTLSTNFDDISAKPLTSSLFTPCGPLPYQDVDARINATLTTKTQAGLWVAGDAATPANAVLAYHDGTKVYLDQIVAGVYTNKISSTVAYAAGTAIRITKSGDTYTLYYGATEVGSSEITGMTGKYVGTFSTYASNSLDNWAVYRSA